MHVVKAVTYDDERQLVWQLGFFKEVFDFLRVVGVGLAANAFDFADLTCSRRRLDVLEVHFRVLAQIHNRAQVVVQTLEAAELFEHLDQLRRAQQIRVLCRDLHDDLQVLPDVGAQHLIQRLK